MREERSGSLKLSAHYLYTFVVLWLTVGASHLMRKYDNGRDPTVLDLHHIGPPDLRSDRLSPIRHQIVLCWIVISSKYYLRDAPNLALTQATAERDFCSFEPFSEDFEKGKRAWIEENPEKKSLEFRCSSSCGNWFARNA
ncbi:uncharacterized protein UHOD_11620 [Ustilago sp. UG-2017b]|nr:uncharacterized protein UHOD_11620 [Ustilago sp. UG-2017b]